MKTNTPNDFGTYLRHLRRQRNLGIRELARQAHLQGSTVVRLEQGQRTPRPDTLKALAPALEVPLSELFTAAGYAMPYDLPDLPTYLRSQYEHLSDETIDKIDRYLKRILDEYDADLNGPGDLEDQPNGPAPS